MTQALLRKLKQLTGDPVLRRWLLGRAFGRWSGQPAFTPHRPPYLAAHLPYQTETASAVFAARPKTTPASPVNLELAGTDVTLRPGDEESLFQTSFDDIENLLSLHRFAWLPAADHTLDADWVECIWSVWCATYATPDASWVWHPYTASERAINMLVFARTHGLSGDQDGFRRCLARHAHDISEKLEYFGDHHTSNHLANNGRGLYLIGLWLGLDAARDLGARILQEEANRIFTATGLLREGSSHYHLLLARNYDEVRRAAHEFGRPEAAGFDAIADRALSFVKPLQLPGGLPLIGDISPDLSPEILIKQLSRLKPVTPSTLAADGWLRFDQGAWSGLWHAAPDGWSPMPGHGHQDLGGFELHYADEPVFVDLGRGAYGETGDAAFYRSALAHNSITVNNRDPYPANRPYYSSAFRQASGGDAPSLEKSDGAVTLTFTSNGRYRHHRNWLFDGNRLSLEDQVSGVGRPLVCRRLHTTLEPEQTANGVRLSGKNTYTVSCPDSTLTITPITRWRAYGRGVAAHQILFSSRAGLPWSGRLQIDVETHGG